MSGILDRAGGSYLRAHVCLLGAPTRKPATRADTREPGLTNATSPQRPADYPIVAAIAALAEKIAEAFIREVEGLD